MDAPWERAGFRHADLRGWAREARGHLIYACLTLAQAWIVAGRPRADASLGSFESWSAVIGGILKVAEVPGFLGNQRSLFTQVEDETREWRPFVLAWWDTYDDETIGVETLYKLAADHELFPSVLGDGFEHSQRTRLGKALGRMRERVIAGYRIASVGEDHRGRQRYRLECVDVAQGADSTRSRRARRRAESEE